MQYCNFDNDDDTQCIAIILFSIEITFSVQTFCHIRFIQGLWQYSDVYHKIPLKDKSK